MKKQRLCIDWDATCVDERFPDMGDWLPGAIKALQTLHKHYELVIFTCRVAPVMQDEVTTHRNADRQAEDIRAMLGSIGLFDVEVWQKPWKPQAIAYVDDKGIEFTGNWPKIVRRLTGRFT